MTSLAVTTPRKSDETRSRILEAALALFRERGFESATMRDIAKSADVALGAAYYYFDSKDALVMAFYERTQSDLAPVLNNALAQSSGLKDRLRAVLTLKLDYFGPNRKLMRALAAHIDPEHPLSPFSRETRDIRDRDIELFSRMLEGSKIRISDDLKKHLPRLLWLYQMGLLLFWLYDRSPKQKRTMELFDKTLLIVVNLVRYSSFPLLRPVRRVVTELLDFLYEEDGEHASAVTP